MPNQAGRLNPSGKWILGGMFIIAMIVFAFEWRWHHGTHKLEFNACLEDAHGLSEGAPVKLEGANIGFVRQITAGGQSCPTRVEIYLNSLEEVMIPDDSGASLSGSEQGEIELIIHPGKSSKPVGLGGMLKSVP